MAKLLAFFFYVHASHSVFASVCQESGEVEPENDDGLFLLQTGSKRTLTPSVNQDHQLPEAGASNGDAAGDSNNGVEVYGYEDDSETGAARRILPQRLFDLGVKLLRTEEVLDHVVANTRQVTYGYSGEEITWRIPNRDHVDQDDRYGLDSLKQLQVNNIPPGGMVNMIDIGGNLGRVSIAAFKKIPEKMRIVVLEPVPSTYFLLVWNLALNNVPELTLEEFNSNKNAPGVLALNNGVAKVDGETAGMCHTPPWTMGARMCNCSAPEDPSQLAEVPQDGVRQCYPIVSRSVDSLIRMFEGDKIAILKMDCEGCEFSAIPALGALPETSLQQILRFAGELHEPTLEMENFMCKFDGGQFFADICVVDGKWQGVPLNQRCQQGPGRISCNRNEQTPAQLEQARLEEGMSAGTTW